MKGAEKLSCGIHPNPPAHQATGGGEKSRAYYESSTFRQGGKLANHCVVSVDMLRSTLHLVSLFVSSIVVRQDFEWTVPQSPWHPARGDIVALCWYTLDQRGLFHMR